MNWLSLLFSILTLYWLATDLFTSQSNVDKVKENKSVSAFITPALLEEDIEIEKQWLKAREEREKREAAELAAKQKADAEANKKQPIPPAYPTLKIGGIDYRLMGIFKSDSTPFILLKAPENSVVKVKLGEEIGKGIVLEQISANKITLKQESEIIEFKLFERNKNA